MLKCTTQFFSDRQLSGISQDRMTNRSNRIARIV